MGQEEQEQLELEAAEEQVVVEIEKKVEAPKAAVTQMTTEAR